MSEAIRSAAQALKTEARQVRAQTRLAIANVPQRRMPIAYRLADPNNLGAAVGDGLAAQNDNLLGQENAFARGGAMLV